MKDLLLFYYNELGNGVPENFEEIYELSLMNSHLFIDSAILEKTIRYYQDEFIKARSITISQKERVGILICGIALFFAKRNDMYNSKTLFELAVPSDNIVALVGANRLHLSNDVMIANYNEMKKLCEETIQPLLCTTSFISIQQIFLNNILQQKALLHTAIKIELQTFNDFIECKNKTTTAIKQAIDLATYTIEFDIESFYNSEELEKLL